MSGKNLDFFIFISEMLPAMKNILFLFILLFSFRALGCICDPPSITENFAKSDFVARAKIVKNYKNEDLTERYKADIEIQELYKGVMIKSIFVYGRSDGRMGSSCALFIPENTELIIYANKNTDGNYSVGYCSGLLYLKNKGSKKEKRDLGILDAFKNSGLSFTNKISFSESPISYKDATSLHEKLEKYKGIVLEKSYGIYQITFATDLKILNVECLSGFGMHVDEELVELLKTTKWTSFHKGIRDQVPDQSKLLVGIYYYPKQNGKESYLTNYYF